MGGKQIWFTTPLKVKRGLEKYKFLKERKEQTESKKAEIRNMNSWQAVKKQ